MASINTYDIGDRLRLWSRFYDFDGNLASPTAVNILVRTPAGAETSVAATLHATGVYYRDVTIDTAGTWHYRGNGTGALIASGEWQFKVRESAFTTPLATP